MISKPHFLFQTNDTLPDRIIIYRDGVGDGRFNFVQEVELEEMKKTFAIFGPDYKPKVTMVIVSKRIITRLLHIGVSVPQKK